MQLELIAICDCCGGLFDGRRHRACDKAWSAWLRKDNYAQWATAAWPSDIAERTAR